MCLLFSARSHYARPVEKRGLTVSTADSSDTRATSTSHASRLTQASSSEAHSYSIPTVSSSYSSLLSTQQLVATPACIHAVTGATAAPVSPAVVVLMLEQL